MNIFPIIITCPARAAVLAETLSNWSRTDWPKWHQPAIVMDYSQAQRPQERQEQNALRALRQGLAVIDGWKCETNGERHHHILFMEDDLEFNRHLYHNLLRWSPLYWKHFGMGSLYNPNIRQKCVNAHGHYFVAEPEAVYGSQAYLLSASCARFIADHWATVPGMQDIKMSRLAMLGGWSIVYHTPSLVQHMGTQSTFGGHFHFAQDYNANWGAL